MTSKFYYLFKKKYFSKSYMLVNGLLRLKQNIASKTLNDTIIDYGARSFKFPLTFLYRMIKVSKTHVARPDRLSYEFYDTDIYGDIICKVNNIPNPFELNENDIITIPAIENIQDFIYNNDDEDIDDELDAAPKAKKKNEKRKANESIVNDVRFKIDNTKRVIIY